MTHLAYDVWLAWRQLRRQPSIALAIVATLTLAIGVNTALFSILRAVVFGTVPVHEPDGLAAIYTVDRTNPGHMPVSDVTAFDIRDALDPDDATGLTFFAVRPASVETERDRLQVTATLVTSNYFEVLGVVPALGTSFTGDDEHGSPEVVVSHGFWRTSLEADADVVGRTLLVEGQPLTIVGVGPEGFAGTNLFDVALFVPYAAHAKVFPDVPWFGVRRFLAFEILVRLRDPERFDALLRRVDEIANDIAAAHPAEIGNRRLHAVPFSHALLGPDRRDTVVLAAALAGTMVGLVLLVACANAANLLLARAATRHGELALRGVLGATPWRLLRQGIVEALLLAAAAGLLSIALAPPLRDGLWSLRPPLLEMATLPPAIDARVLGFTAATTLLTGLVFGAAPALRAARVDVTVPLRFHATAGAASHRRVRSALVVVQVALSFIALLGAGLLLRSVVNARAVDPGFDLDGLVAFDLDASPSAATRIASELELRLAAHGIEAVAVSTGLPFGSNEFRRTIEVPEPARSDAPPGLLVRTTSIDPAWFATLGIDLVHGRGLRVDEDMAAPYVAVVNDTFAAIYWGREEPVGRSIRFAGVEKPIEIVGVVETVKVESATEPPTPQVYVPLAQWPHADLQLVMRASDPRRAIDEVWPILAARDDMVVSRARPLADDRDAALGPLRSAATLLLLFGGLALALATLGIHSVMAYAVRQRTREIGIRMALGAQAHHVMRRILGDAAGLVLIGNAIGIAGGLVVQYALAHHLFAVPVGDPLTFGGVGLVVSISALAATWSPARAATRVDPARAIHHG